ncbi:MAG: histidinol dehydrogenase [Candidatus Methanospirareceae archaeon]
MIRKIAEVRETAELFSSRTLDLVAVMPLAQEILTAVKQRGDAAVRAYTEQFDHVTLTELAVTDAELEAASSKVAEETLSCIEAAAEAIRNFHYRQKRKSWLEEFADGIYLGEKFVPFDVVGVYVPGSYFSSALMCVLPAKIAGVREIVVCTPPKKDGTVDPHTLIAADLAGATRICKVGGAQAIAALAFGTETVPRAQKIVGPGNVYVTAAKMAARAAGVEIDFPAGPSEVLIIGDETANPSFIAADMLAQAEHGAKSQAVLLTTSHELAVAVERELTAAAPAMKAAQHWLLVGESLDECFAFANEYAPEHLEIVVREPMDALKRIKHAGSVFIGNYAPVAAGDYATGANHVLPTAGYPKLFSGLDVDHFMHRMTLQWLDKDGLARIKEVVVQSCRAEGMERHAQSVEKRFSADVAD